MCANRILNDPSVGVNPATYAAQARPDAGDTDVWAAGWQRTGVISGCAVTAVGSGMNVDVASGVVAVNDVPVAITGVNRTIATASGSDARIDLVVASSAGVVSVTTGPMNARAVWPAIPANSVVLATVYVPAGATTISNAEIVDKRVLLASRLRQTATKVTGTLPNAAYEPSTVALATGFRLVGISTDKPARVRVYDRVAKQSADLTRAVDTPLTGDHGLLLEYVTTLTVLSATLSPEVDGHSMETTPVRDIPITVTNLSGTTGVVTVQLTWVQTE